MEPSARRAAAGQRTFYLTVWFGPGRAPKARSPTVLDPRRRYEVTLDELSLYDSVSRVTTENGRLSFSVDGALFEVRVAPGLWHASGLAEEIESLLPDLRGRGGRPLVPCLSLRCLMSGQIALVLRPLSRGGRVQIRWRESPVLGLLGLQPEDLQSGLTPDTWIGRSTRRWAKALHELTCTVSAPPLSYPFKVVEADQGLIWVRPEERTYWPVLPSFSGTMDGFDVRVCDFLRIPNRSIGEGLIGLARFHFRSCDGAF